MEMQEKTHTTSSIREWRMCKRRYRYRYVDLVRLVQPGRALTIGTAFHEGLELFLAGKSVEEILHYIDAACCGDWWDSPDGQIELRRLRAMLRAYYNRWAKTRDNWRVKQIEGVFDAEFAPSSRFSGKVDALLEHIPSDCLYLWEHKTAGDEIDTVGADYWQRLGIDLQVTTYQVAMQRQYGKPVAILYDVARKPTGKPRLKTRIAKRKSETQDEYEARKDAARETLDEFEERLFQEMLQKPDAYLVRREIHRTPDQNATLFEELRETIHEIDTYEGAYARNEGACQSRYGLCPYLGVCTGTETLDSPRFKTIPGPHAELDQPQLAIGENDGISSSPF